jgi:hypothetical protein
MRYTNRMTDLTNQEKLEEIYRLSLENNRLLHNIQARDRMALIFRILYWLVIVGALGGAYIYIHPFYQAIKDNNTKAQGVLQQFEQLREQFPETKAFQQLFNQIKDSPEDPTPEATDTEPAAQ